MPLARVVAPEMPSTVEEDAPEALIDGGVGVEPLDVAEHVVQPVRDRPLVRRRAEVGDPAESHVEVVEPASLDRVLLVAQGAVLEVERAPYADQREDS